MHDGRDGDGDGHGGHGHGGHGHSSRDHDGHGDSGSQGGAQDTEFLDLEISKVLHGEALELTRDAFRELLKEALKVQLKERHGRMIESLARVATDELTDDLQTNLAIEALIEARRQRTEGMDQRLRDVFRAESTGSTSPSGNPPPSPED